MIGSICGDICGSIYEFTNNIKTMEFPLFTSESTYTDDSIMTISTAFSILHNIEYGKCYKIFGRRFPNRGYGGNFRQWIDSDTMGPYNSFGNGSAMRVSPIAWAFESPDDVMSEAEKSAEVTHNHPEGIKGAQAAALTTYFARLKLPKEEIRSIITKTFDYDLNRTCDQIRPTYKFDVSCQGSVPEAIIAFLDSTDYENAIRLAISLGGDADTLACITGGIAQAYYPTMPKEMTITCLKMLPKNFLKVIRDFQKKYNIKVKVLK